VDVNVVKAPMPGLVIEIQCQPGDQVEKGQVLVILESMKMQMQLRSPADAVVASIPAQVGQRVEKGDLLVKFDLAAAEK
jgi:biotin carboxyl carrier protein